MLFSLVLILCLLGKVSREASMRCCTALPSTRVTWRSSVVCCIRYGCPRFCTATITPAVNKRVALEDVGILLDVKKPSDWYSVSMKKFLKRGGAELLASCNLPVTGAPYLSKRGETVSPLHSLLTEIYPERKWDRSRFVAAANRRSKAQYWRNTNNLREFLESVASEMKLDQMSDWYAVAKNQVVKKGGAPLFRLYGSLEGALTKAYPDYPWQSHKFIDEGRAPNGFWKQKENIFKGLDWVESYLGVKNPEDWYSVRMKGVTAAGFPTNISRTEIIKLLAEKYPHIKWDTSKLLPGILKKVIDPNKPRKSSTKLEKRYWAKLENRRNFFLELAKEIGFDPYVVTNWNYVSIAKIKERRGRSLLLRYGSLRKALQLTFPELDFSRMKVQGQWSDNNKCRGFFCKYAELMKFDPMDPQQWEKVTPAQIRSKMGDGPFVRFKSLTRALKEVFPELEFNFKPKAVPEYWKDSANCRQFFDDYAKAKGFDPLHAEHWYAQNLTDVINSGGATIQKYWRSIRIALRAAYPEVDFVKWPPTPDKLQVTMQA